MQLRSAPNKPEFRSSLCCSFHRKRVTRVWCGSYGETCHRTDHFSFSSNLIWGKRIEIGNLPGSPSSVTLVSTVFFTRWVWLELLRWHHTLDSQYGLGRMCYQHGFSCACCKAYSEVMGGGCSCHSISREGWLRHDYNGAISKFFPRLKCHRPPCASCDLVSLPGGSLLPSVRFHSVETDNYWLLWNPVLFAVCTFLCSLVLSFLCLLCSFQNSKLSLFPSYSLTKPHPLGPQLTSRFVLNPLRSCLLLQLWDLLESLALVATQCSCFSACAETGVGCLPVKDPIVRIGVQTWNDWSLKADRYSVCLDL